MVMVCFLLIVQSSLAQDKNLKFDRVIIEDGLTSVNCIIKDRYGFMWFGGSNGLYRFDGYDYRIFTHSPKDSTSLTSNNIVSLYEDKDGYLWVGTMNAGLNRYDPLHESFVQYRHNETPFSISNNYVTCITQDHTGKLWIGTMEGLNCFDPRQNTFRRFLHDPSDSGSISSNEIFSILEEGDGTFWITSNKGVLDLFDTQHNTAAHYTYHDGYYNSGRTGQRVIRDYTGNLWIGTEGDGLYRFDKRMQTFTNFRFRNEKGSLSNNIITDLKEGDRGELWITTDGGGLNHLDFASSVFTHEKYDPNDPFSVSNNSSYALYIDEKKVLWLGMGDGMVNTLRQTPFELFMPSQVEPNSLSFRVVVSLFMGSDNKLWIGSGGAGLDVLDLKTRLFRNYRYDPANEFSISTDIILALCEDKDKNLWIGTFLGGLDRFDITHQFFHHLRHDPNNANSLSHDHVFDVVAGRDDEIWIATHGGGLNLYDKKRKLFRRFKSNDDRPGTLGSDRVLCLFADHRKDLWIGTLDAGLQRYDRQQDRFINYNYKDVRKGDLEQYPIHHIMEDHDGNLWISTGGGGIHRYDPRRDIFTPFTTDQGLPSNSVYGSIQDDQKKIWMSTNHGIVRYDQGKIVTYNVADGLPTNDFECGAIVLSHTGELFFGSKKGLISFDPRQLKDNTEQVKVTLTGLRIFNDLVYPGQQIEDAVPLRQSISRTGEIELPHNLNNFSFEFAAPGYSAPAKIRFMYRLKGLDDRWIETDAGRRVATFSSLDAGDYTFEVIAANSDGVWSGFVTATTIRVTPPFWGTRLAYTGYLIAAAIVIIGIARETRKRILLKNQLAMEKYKHEKDVELYASKINLFTNISHELRTPLTLILGPLERLMVTLNSSNRVTHQLMVMHRNGLRLMGLVNQLLDFRKLESGNMKLQVKEDDLVRFVREVAYSFQELAAQRQVQFESTFLQECITGWFDRQKLEIIINNLLSNAFKFTPRSGSVSLDVRTDPTGEHVILKVEDTGDGIANSEMKHIFDLFYQAERNRTGISKGTGIGLALTKSLVELHHGRIEFTSALGKGTSFVITLPLRRESYKNDELYTGNDHEASPLPEEILREEWPGEDPHEISPENATDDNRCLMLIAEDNKELREYIRDEFATHYKIEEASDGREAFEKAVNSLPDIIISDVMMPVLDGLELCKKLKQDERTSHIPVILLTARSSHIHQYEGLDTGADDYVTKPFSFDLLSARVVNLIESRKRLRERFSREVVLKPKDIAIANPDERFLERIMQVMEEHMSDPGFSVKVLAKEVGMSHSVLYRKVMALTDKPVNDLIRSIRLQRAQQLLRETHLPVGEISDMTGFSNAKYFSTCFRTLFGISPTEYVESLNREPIP